MRYLPYTLCAITVLAIASCGGIGGTNGYTHSSPPNNDEVQTAEVLDLQTNENIQTNEESASCIADSDQDEIEDGERQGGISLDECDEEFVEREIPIDSMPPGGAKIKTRQFRSLRKTFLDSNHIQLCAAQEIGIDPIEKISDAWNLRKPIIKITSTSHYYVDNLTYSLPYLVPEAKNLLDDISRSWYDSLQARGGGEYRLKVTSLLRTKATVSKLRRRNIAAVDSSTHLYGTTFDISCSKFICDDVSKPRTAQDLRLLLAEILYDLREQGRCYVTFEHKQKCFHITTRK